MKSFKPGAARALFLSTTAFAVSFAVLGLIGALAPTFARAYGLSAKEKSPWGFIFLALFALFCLAVNYLVFLRSARPMRIATALTGSISSL
jgi:nitrate/nitrite transporter NarK